MSEATSTAAEDRPGWNEDRTAWWLSVVQHRERQLAPVSEALFAAARLRSGDRVLDVGCGGGSTTLRAHQLVGPDGRVTGNDISVGMINAARRNAGSADIEWLVGDAQDTDFGEARFDAIISRFGVMFFADPHAAFANLSRACAPHGRLAVTVWKQPGQVPLFDIPMGVLAKVFTEAGRPVPAPPDGLSPVSLGDPDFVTALLHDTGWQQVDLVDPDLTLYLEGGLSPDQAAEVSLHGGPVGQLLQGQPDDLIATVRTRLTRAYSQRWDGTGIAIPGRFWVVTARPAV